jgi:hypothetical protein
MYDGFWKDGKKHGLGVFRPAADEPSSRRHSQGWPSQPPAAAAATAAAAVAASGPEAADSGPPSPDPFARASLQQQQQQQQEDSEAHSSSRAADEAEGLDPPMELHRTLSDQPQQPSCLMPAAVAAASPELAALRRTVAPMHPVPSTGSLANIDAIPPAAAAAVVAAGTGPAKAPPAAGALGAAVSAAAAGGGGHTGAPLRLFVREYDSGTLMRQDALSAEEIRMIFGFLWSKKPNKVRASKGGREAREGVRVCK